MRFVAVIKYRFDPSWLRLDRARRTEIEQGFASSALAPFLAHGNVTQCDAEAFHADFSDFMLVQTESIREYYFLIERIRDSALIADGYVEIVDVTVGFEDGYKEFESRESESRELDDER